MAKKLVRFLTLFGAVTQINAMNTYMGMPKSSSKGRMWRLYSQPRKLADNTFGIVIDESDSLIGFAFEDIGNTLNSSTPIDLASNGLAENDG